jgi:3-methyladenine DNA glycosylase/8-oxoguanine DNA glycosylase
VRQERTGPTPVAWRGDGALSRTWHPPGELDVGLTLGPLRRGLHDPAFRAAPDGALWRSSRTPGGPGTLRISVRPAEGAVHGQAWGPGAEWLLNGLPALLGADDDPAGFESAHPLLRDAHRRHPGLRICRTGLVLESLVPAILEQKVTTIEAYRGWRLLLTRFGTPAPGPTPGPMWVAPSAREWAMVPSWEWHRAGVDAKRAATVLHAVRLAPRLEEASAMPPEAAAVRLTSVPGIGPWTLAETVQRSNGDADAVSVGDLHLPNTVGWALAGRPRTDDTTMLELLAPYAGHRHRACRLILLTGRRAPRYGPRLAPNDYRNM